MLAFERSRGKRSLYGSLPRPACVALTFVLVLVAWVFFRARDLPAAVAYLGSMAGLTRAQEGAGLIAGVIYQPYYVLCMVAAATVVWGCPQTWEWTRRLSWRRAAMCVACLWLALAVLVTQAYNPFIYFIF
jgi:alginate O-acetyltransferase complex protein AlgI